METEEFATYDTNDGSLIIAADPSQTGTFYIKAKLSTSNLVWRGTMVVTITDYSELFAPIDSTEEV